MFSFVPAWIFGGVLLALGGAALLLKHFLGPKSPWSVALSTALNTLAKDVQAVDRIDQEVASLLSSKGLPLTIAQFIGKVVEDAVRTVIRVNQEYDSAKAAEEVVARIVQADASVVQQTLTTIPITSREESAYALLKLTELGIGPAKLEEMAKKVLEGK